jgi:transcriptional regulator with XRE-family HTH domain
MMYNINMEDIKEVISQNIATIRKKRKLTQVELSEKLNYSDKAISRWEKGESLPDIETLHKLSEILDVPVASFFEENAFAKQEFAKKKNLPNKIIVALLSCLVVWIIATILYVYVYTYSDIKFWQAFIWAIPATTIILSYYNKIWGWPRISIFLHSATMWSLLTAMYCQFLNYNIWIMFLLGALVQVIIVLNYFIKPIKTDSKIFGIFNIKK